MTFTPTDHTALVTIIAEIGQLQESLLLAESQWGPQIDAVNPHNRASARNLAHYWAIRQHDLRGLQRRLAGFGLSSLGRSEPHVRATLDAIATAAGALIDPGPAGRTHVDGFDEGARLLRRRTAELFGTHPAHRETRIMVTLPSEAATDASLVRALVEHGMDLARINCAHDDARAWAAMIAHVREASAAAGRECRIAMDIAGPKLRTGPLAEGPQVIKIRPLRDRVGRVTAPARCWLSPAEEHNARPQDGLPTLPLPRAWLARLRAADDVDFRDTRGARRHLVVQARHGGHVLASLTHTAYVGTGTVLHAPGGDRAAVGWLPPTEQYLTLRRGQDLILTRNCEPADVSPDGPPRIGCTLADAFTHVLPGQVVHFDDGKISGLVGAADPDQLTIRITHAAVNGSRLRAAKGINLPETLLPIPALTDADRANLPFIAAHADIVELSFARTAHDVEDLLSALDELGADLLGVVVKVETALGFENLPAILFAAMGRRHTGVMIARGDLAVECGYERLAELQEEILWVCEAAHLPVIWATQVLEREARSGQPSRAEITDAAMGVRAECVMLNKGPHIVDAVVTLDDILRRMTAHHDKNNTLMRPLRSWPPPSVRARSATIDPRPSTVPHLTDDADQAHA